MLDTLNFKGYLKIKGGLYVDQPFDFPRPKRALCQEPSKLGEEIFRASSLQTEEETYNLQSGTDGSGFGTPQTEKCRCEFAEKVARLPPVFL